YSSNLTHWRQQISKGALKALSPKKRGPKPDPLANENVALRRRIERLEAELKRAETIIKGHLAVDTLAHLLDLCVTAADEQDCAKVSELAKRVQEETGETVEI